MRILRRAHPQTRGSKEAEHSAQIAALTRSRRAVADAYEVERQRIERDVHDGAQQYFVAAAIKLGEASLELEGTAGELVSAALDNLHQGLNALRASVRGISPQVMRERGLVAAVREVAATYGPHVSVHAPHKLPELSPSVLAAGYFFSCEALTNAAKYAPGAAVSVLLTADQNLRICVLDQGPGGAQCTPGGGLAGMQNRLLGFGGQLELISPAGGPTRVSATIPLFLERGQTGVAL